VDFSSEQGNGDFQYTSRWLKSFLLCVLSHFFKNKVLCMKLCFCFEWYMNFNTSSSARSGSVVEQKAASSNCSKFFFLQLSLISAHRKSLCLVKMWWWWMFPCRVRRRGLVLYATYGMLILKSLRFDIRLVLSHGFCVR